MDDFTGATVIGRLSFARSVGEWRFRYTDSSGKRRFCCRTEKKDAEKAHAAAKKAALVSGARKPKLAAKVTPANLDPDSARAWSAELVWYRDQIRAAVERRDDEDLDRTCRAAKTVAALGTAQVSQRDLAGLEDELAAIRQWRDEIFRANKLGTSSNTAGAGEGATFKPPRPGDPVH